MAIRLPSKRERWKLDTLGKTPTRVWSRTNERGLIVETPLAIEDLKCVVCFPAGSLVWRRHPSGVPGFDFRWVCNSCGAYGIAHCGVQTL